MRRKRRCGTRCIKHEEYGRIEFRRLRQDIRPLGSRRRRLGTLPTREVRRVRRSGRRRRRQGRQHNIAGRQPVLDLDTPQIPTSPVRRGRAERLGSPLDGSRRQGYRTARAAGHGGAQRRNGRGRRRSHGRRPRPIRRRAMPSRARRAPKGRSSSN